MKYLFPFSSFLLLFLWVFIYKYTCSSLVLYLIALVLIGRNSFELLRAKRICMADCYLNKESFWYAFFTRKFFIFLFSLIISIVISVSLFIYAAVSDWYDVVLGVFILFASIFIYEKLKKVNIFSENVKNIFARNWASFIVSIVFTIILVILNINQPPPEYLSNDLISTVSNASKEVFSNCDVNQFILKLSVEVEAIKWWIMVKFSISNHQEWLKAVIWFLFFVSNYIVVLAFSKLVLEIYEIGSKVWKKIEK